MYNLSNSDIFQRTCKCLDEYYNEIKAIENLCRFIVLPEYQKRFHNLFYAYRADIITLNDLENFSSILNKLEHLRQNIKDVCIDYLIAVKSQTPEEIAMNWMNKVRSHKNGSIGHSVGFYNLESSEKFYIETKYFKKCTPSLVEELACNVFGLSYTINYTPQRCSIPIPDDSYDPLQVYPYRGG
jgi:hypothetical protein